MLLRGRTMFAPTMRVVDGADPYKIKTRVKPITKIKNTNSTPSAHGLHPRCPVSATPTHMLRICVNPRHALSAGVQNNACTNLLGFFV